MPVLTMSSIATVSIIIPTKNSQRTFERCLTSIRNQKYPQSKVEIIVVDGGSTDNTRFIAKENNCKIITDLHGDPEYAKGVGLQHTTGKYIAFVASDNILPDEKWLAQMVGILEMHQNLVATYPWRYAYTSELSSLNRYFALLGANDPIARWLGRADRQSYLADTWELAGQVTEKKVINKLYWLVSFHWPNIPTLGDNGFVIRRSILEHVQVDPEHFSHTDIGWDLIQSGFTTFGVVNTTIEHDTGENFNSFIRKRWRYARQLYFQKKKVRRYQWLPSWQDNIRVIAGVLFFTSFVAPGIVALRGYLKKPDVAWFWHPVIGFVLTWLYVLLQLEKMMVSFQSYGKS